MNRIKHIWGKYGGWLLLGLPVAIVTLCFAVSAASENLQPRTIAEPPAEQEITFDMDKNRAYTAKDGIVVIGGDEQAAAVSSSDKELPVPLAAENIVPQAVPVAARPAYTLPEQTQMKDGSIGVLSISKLKLSVNVFESDDAMEAMTHGLAHFKTSSAWDGNVALCGHNVNFNLSDGYFKNLHTLTVGDAISYKTALGNRSYIVETVTEIVETDWSYLGRTEDNRITLVTCISGKPKMRLIVQATAI